MDGDLISRSALEKHFEKHARLENDDMDFSARDAWTGALWDVQDAPAVDAEPVRRGEWTEPYKNDIWDCYVCSSCGYAQDRTSRYCPECGARMDAE